MIAGVTEQKRKRRTCYALYPKFARHNGDGSEREVMRFSRSSRDARYCWQGVKIRRDDGDNYPHEQECSDKFEPEMHGNPTQLIIAHLIQPALHDGR